MTPTLPILYSFRRCPYAIRARLAITHAGLEVELREVLLRDKPAALLAISPKGTVPVLQLAEGRVLEQSLDIMRWAMSQCTPEQALPESSDGSALIEQNDGAFKYYLDRYKYADRYPEHSREFYRQQAEPFLQVLEQRLNLTYHLCGNQQSFADMAIVPFIRQFSMVEPVWFAACSYTAVSVWLKTHITNPIFDSVMCKYKPWVAK